MKWMILLSITLQVTAINIKKNLGSGVLLENYGPVGSIVNKFELYVKIDMKQISDQSDLEAISQKIKSYCEINEKLLNYTSFHCSNFDASWKLKLQEMQKELSVIIDEKKKINGRSKRELFWVGEVYKFCFGIMSNSDRKDIYGQLENLKNYVRDINKIQIDDIELFRKEITALNNTKQQINFNAGVLNKTIHKLHILIKRNKEYRFEQIISFTVNKLMIQADRKINAMREVFDILKDTNNGFFHPKLIDLKELVNVTKRYKLKDSQTFPFDLKYLDKNLFSKIIDVSSFENKNDIFVKISMPLIAKAHFKLMKLHPLPYFHNSSIMSYVETPEGFVVVDDVTKKYMVLNNLDKCKKIKEIHYCKRLNRFHNDEKTCVSQILKERNNFSFCNRKMVKTDSVLIMEINEENSFIISVEKEVSAIVVENGISRKLKLTGNSVISSKTDAKLHLKNIEINFFGSLNENSAIVTTFKTFNMNSTFFSIEYECLNDLKLIDIPTPLVLSYAELNDISVDSQMLLKKSRDLLENNSQFKHYYAMYSGMGGIFLILGVMVIVLIYSKKNSAFKVNNSISTINLTENI